MYTQFNLLGDHPLIPEQAFLFLPKRSQDPNLNDDYRMGEGKNIRRLLFEGWAEQTYTPYERQKLKQLDNHIAKNNIKLDTRWDHSWRLRWYLSTGCNLKKCIDDMKIFTEYQDRVRDIAFTPSIAKFLRQGIYYMAGRDSHYRPILVFDVEKVIKLEMTEEQVLQTQTYFFEYVLRNLLIPGQIENWIVIVDAAQIGLFSLIGSMKKSFSFLSETYRSRMFVCYVVRIPTSISFLWGIVKKFLEESTVRKINFFDESTIEPLFEFCNPSQVQVRFGGTLPNIQEGNFWPPREVSTDYKCSKQPVKLLSRQEYTQYYNKKIFYNTKFHEQNIIIPPTKEDLRQNRQAHIVKRLEKELKRLLQTSVQETFQQTSISINRPLNYLQLMHTSKLIKEQQTAPLNQFK